MSRRQKRPKQSEPPFTVYIPQWLIDSYPSFKDLTGIEWVSDEEDADCSINTKNGQGRNYVVSGSHRRTLQRVRGILTKVPGVKVITVRV